MAQVVFSYDFQSSALAVCKDGMLLLQIQGLSDIKPESTVSGFYEWWEHHVEHLNCLYFLLYSSAGEKIKLAYPVPFELMIKDVFQVSVEDEKAKALLEDKHRQMIWHSNLRSFYPDISLGEEVFDTLAQKYREVLKKDLVQLFSFPLSMHRFYRL